MKKYILVVFMATFALAQNVFAQNPIHIVVEEGLTLDIYSNKYVINYCSPEYMIENDTVISNGIRLEDIEECPFCNILDVNRRHIFSHIEFLTGEYDALDSLGYPALPLRSLNLQFPDDWTNISVSINNFTTQRIYFRYPYIPHMNIMRSMNAFTIPMHSYYQTNGAGFFDTWYSISDTYSFMGTTGATFNIYPLRYNPNEKYADIIKCVTFTIYFSYTTSLLDLINEYVSGTHYGDAMTFYDTYKGLEWKEKAADKGNYVILTYNTYRKSLDEFIAYKQSIGYNVMVYNVPNDVPAYWKDIRRFIKNLYNNSSTKPRFLLLVGNTNQIPYSAGYARDTKDPPTDIYYACIEKNVDDYKKEDMNPEIIIGRWSVYNTDEVEYITKKTIKTELALFNTPKRDRHFSLFAGSGDYSSWFRGDMNWTIDMLQDGGLGSYYTYFDGRNGQGLIHMINELIGNNQVEPFVFIYDGHGSSTHIDSPYYLYSNAGTIYLQNSHLSYLPFGFGFACLLNDYSYHNHTFGEGWTTYSKNGGVSFLGATTNSYVEPDRYFSRRVLKHFKESHNYQIGQVVAWGQSNYYNACKTKTRRREVAKYNLLGDPSLMIYGTSQNGAYGHFAPSRHDNYVEVSSNINVFPTLASDFVRVEATPDNSISSVVLYGLNGQIIKTFNVFDNLNVQDIENGQYILLVVSNNKTYSFKIIINH
ncbi:MAG: C25 family cysteine peptidase [Prevotellaceae bacterium]|jgi:hypothetical protein|nr:C25 family cysteine peptidase [Prevotellaceae bacterium]